VIRAQTEALGTVKTTGVFLYMYISYFSYVNAWQQPSMSVYKKVNTLKSIE